MSQFHFDPDSYLAMMRADVPCYDQLQDVVATATAGLDVQRILELGTGTGETARRILAVHPRAALVGIDSVNIDDTATGERPVHTGLLGAGIYVLEHLTGLAQLDEPGFELFAVPVKVRGMGTFPVRAFARYQ